MLLQHIRSIALSHAASLLSGAGKQSQETNHQAQLTQQATCASAGSLLVQVYCKRAGPFCAFQGAGQFERMIFLGCGFSTY